MRQIFKYLAFFLSMTAALPACGGRESWPPETKGPNLPVRCCDIEERERSEALIGYVLVDTMAVNWMLTNLMKGSSLYIPELSDLRKAELILQKEYPSILAEHGYDKEGHLYEAGGLRNYARQYLFMKSPGGGKFVFINFVLLKWADLEDNDPPVYDLNDPDFIPPPPGRHALSRYWFGVDDGGDGYWRAMLDLDNGKVMWLIVNGLA